MMSRMFGNARAFFLGFAMVSRNSAAGTLNQYRSRILAGLMLTVYYGVMGYYFLHHAKNAPKEQVSDQMVFLFQAVLAMPFYMGFHKLVLFLQREDVQRAFALAVGTARTHLLFVWDKLVIAATLLWAVTVTTLRGIVLVSTVVAKALKQLTLGTLRFGKRILLAVGQVVGAGAIIALACSMEGCKSAHVWTSHRVKALKRFAANCVEVGQSARM